MIWGSPRRQYTWLAVGARTFALLTLAMPLLLSHDQLMLLALLSIGAIWAAVTAGELLEVPATVLLVLDAALVGTVAGLASSGSNTAVLGALAVPPFTAGLARGTRGVALSLSAELATVVGISLFGHTLTPELGSVAFTWAITGLGLGLIASFVRTNFLDGSDPQRAYRDAQALIRELIGLSGRLQLGSGPGGAGRPDRERGARRAPGGGAHRPHPPRGGAHAARGRHRPRRPRPRHQRELAQYCLATGNVRVVGTASPSTRPRRCARDRGRRWRTGVWKALDEVYPGTCRQRCWHHKTANLLNKVPKSVQRAMKADLREVHGAPTRAGAEAAIDVFARIRTYPRAAECLTKDREALLAFYDLPAEHWDHLRTSNPIESVFATVRHRTVRTKGALSQATARLMVFKLVMAAAKTWRRLNGETQLPKVVAGVTFQDGTEVIQPPSTRAA